ncbi:imelysin family protein [Candidatus Njordibacter sp. Uisw_056]|jgi:predicted lipoprotein|uniref:imelysin family protein n=1 Tax=Candidatus Njordibacter sp. Uisw_056 TaxID=3230973 RepID=UPI003D478218|tara:strand:- start:729 stop:1820 length:1092 start_codon:yes stop_codon:yes gene_type:complete
MVKKCTSSHLIPIIFAALTWFIIIPSHANLLVSNNEVKAWVDQYVLPSYKNLHQANLHLQTHAGGLCDAKSLHQLDKMQPHFSKALEAMAYSQAIDGGPMQDELRNFQLYFWPDRNNLVNKQLAKLIDESNLQVLQELGLEHASVALAGYPALERLLFEPYYRQTVIQDQEKFGCYYIVTITNNLVRITAAINEDWSAKWRAQLVGPSVSNSRFKKPADQVSFIFSNIDVLLTKIITKKLAKPLASKVTKAKPKRLESWRSSNSLIMLKANARGLTDSLNITLKPALIRAGETPHWHQISNHLSLIQQKLDQLPRPLVTHLSEPQHWLAVNALQEQFIQLQAKLRELYPRLNVHLGFNAYDGD